MRLGAYESSGKTLARGIAATVCGSGPLLAADAKGWRFDGRATGLSLLLPQAAARIDQSAAQAAIRGDGHGMTAGHVTVTASRLTDMTVPVRFHPLNGTATVDLSNGVWQGDAAPTYEFVVFRSYAAAFWRAIASAAAEFGVAVER